MEIVETTVFKNLPKDIKLVDAQISSAYGEFLSRNPDAVVNEIEIKFKGGTFAKEIKREVA